MDEVGVLSVLAEFEDIAGLFLLRSVSLSVAEWVQGRVIRWGLQQVNVGDRTYDGRYQ